MTHRVICALRAAQVEKIDERRTENKSGKVKVMYVRSDDDSDKRTHNPRTGKGGGRPGKSRVDGRSRPARDERNSRGDDRKRDDRKRDDRKRDDFHRDDASPWRTVSRAPGDETPVKEDHGGISGKSFIDPEVLRRQRAEETRVYGENACQALFQSRPEAIVRAWFIQSVTPRFKEALRWMAANRKAYHVVDEAELAKASGTEHHGGVCFLIKKTPRHLCCPMGREGRGRRLRSGAGRCWQPAQPRRDHA